MSEDVCRVCDNGTSNKLHRAREMLQGTRDEFDYIECASCGTLQIREVPELGPYYAGAGGAAYYSMRTSGVDSTAGGGLKRKLLRSAGTFLRRRVVSYYGGRRRRFGELRHPLGRLLAGRGWRAVSGLPEFLRDAPVDLGFSAADGVLDVGSGTGDTLLWLRYFGFRDLVGIDPFLEKDVEFENGVRLLKAELSDLSRLFGLVLASHSLEHLPDTRQALRDIHRLLEPGHYAVVRIPLLARAWREYGVNWVQMDAPRHLFLFTAETFKALAEEGGFAVDAVVYDSTGFQFWGSEQYLRDIPLTTDVRSHFINPTNSVFTAEEIAAFEARAAELNRAGEGDQAVFYLRKI
jgi:SAM-dependent methyltransferase